MNNFRMGIQFMLVKKIAQFTPALFIWSVSNLSFAEENMVTSAETTQQNYVKFGGAVRLRFDYDHNQDIRKLGLDTIILNGEFKWNQFSGQYEHRILGGSYPYQYVNNIGDINFVKKAYVQYDFNKNSNIQVGVNQVPIGLQPYYTSSFIESLGYVAGLEDLYRTGFKYTYQRQKDQFLVGYYFANPWKGKGTSNGAYYSNVIVSADPSLENGTDFKEKNAIALQWNRNDTLKGFETNYGLSLYYSKLDSKQQKDADRSVIGPHIMLNKDLYNLKFQALYQNIKTGNDDQSITVGAYDGTMNMAAKGVLYSLDLTRKVPMLDIKGIEGSSIYLNYNLFDKDDRSFKDTQRIVLGHSFSFGKGFFMATEFLFGKNDPYVGDSFSQSFAGGGENKWKNKININLGYYF